MNTASTYKHSDITEKIIYAFFKVHNALGYGFTEKVYENAMVIELRKLGLEVKQQHPVTVFYEGEQVGEYYTDMIVEDKVILELKATRNILPEHEAQLLNYLKATQYEVGLLLNFSTSATHKRKAFDNDRKGNLSWTKHHIPK